MKCPRCNGTGKIKQPMCSGSYCRKYICPYCNGTGEIEQTNEEWFCLLSTEEKAKWFCDHITCSDGCRFYGKCFNEQIGRELWKEWLKQPHTKE